LKGIEIKKINGVLKKRKEKKRKEKKRKEKKRKEKNRNTKLERQDVVLFC
jgi:hypothetical protein